MTFALKRPKKTKLHLLIRNRKKLNRTCLIFSANVFIYEGLFLNRSQMVAQSATAPKESKKENKNVNLPSEVSDAISESGGLDHLLGAIKPGEIKAKAELHRILSDTTRLTILQAIKQCDMCPCVLKVLMKISDSRLSYHLTVLEEAGLLRSYKQKNWKIYSITDRGRSI